MSANIGYATLQVIPSLKGVSANVEKQLGASTAVAQSAGAATGKRFGSGFGSSVKSIAKTMGALFAAAEVGKFFKDSVKGAEENMAIQRQTAAVIKSTASAAGVSRKQVEDLSMSIANYSGLSDEAVQSTANMLLTFKNIKNTGTDKIFDATTKAAIDMSRAMKTDGKSSAVMLGKALNDPVKGLAALSRVGVTFTASQEKQVKAMVAAGDTLGAQKLILKEVNSEFAGAAAAAATPAEKLKTQWGRLQVMVGQKLIPVIDRLMAFTTTKVIPGFMAVVGWVSKNAAVIKPLVTVVLGIVAAWKLWNGVMLIWNAISKANTFVLIATAVVGIATALIYAYKHSETFRAIVQGAFNAIKTAAMAVADFFVRDIPAAWNTVIGALQTAWNAVFGFIKKWGPLALAAIAPFIGIPLLIWQHFGKITGWLAGVWNTVYRGVTGFVGDVVGAIASIPGKIGQLGGKMLQAGKNLMGSIFQGVKDAAGALGGWAADIGRTIWNALKDFINSKLLRPIKDFHFKINLGVYHKTFQPFGSLPLLARGGMTTGPMAAVLGDNPSGNELVMPMDSPRTIRTLAQSMREAFAAMPGGPTNGGVNLTIHEADNVDKVAGEVMRRLKFAGVI